MKRKVSLIDTNIILRFLTSDNPRQTEIVEKLFSEAEDKELVISDLVIAEIVYVLFHAYHLDKQQVIEKIQSLIFYPKFNMNKSLIIKTLNFYSKHNVSFIDAYLCALSTDQSYEKLYTFDKKILRIKELNASTPG